MRSQLAASESELQATRIRAREQQAELDMEKKLLADTIAGLKANNNSTTILQVLPALCVMMQLLLWN